MPILRGNFQAKNSFWIQDSETEFRTERFGFGNFSAGNLGWIDYTLSMDIEFREFKGYGNIRIMARQNGLFDSYSLDIDQKGLFLRRYDGRWDRGETLGIYESKIALDNKYSLEFSVCDNQFSVIWDGKEVISAIDKANKYPFGGALIRSEMSKVRLSNVAIEIANAIDEKEATKQMWENTQKLLPLPKKPKHFQSALEAGFNNMMLIYTGYYGGARGVWTYEDALFYTAYIEKNGKIKDTFFDAFLFLGIGSPNGRFFDATRGGDVKTAANLEDWQWYIDKLYRSGEQLAAFDKAKGEVNLALGAKEKAKIAIMIPNPLSAQDNFGEIDNKNLNFSTSGQSPNEAFRQRMKAIAWYVDTIVGKWDKANFENLELYGFYWMSEDMSSSNERQVVDQTADMLHGKDYKFIWIPYNKAPGYDYPNKFDAVFLQPNYMFSDQVALTRFYHTYVDALTYGTNFEIEGEETVLESEEAKKRYLDYLKAGVTLGYIDSAKAYYFGGKGLMRCGRSDDASVREVYDKTYLFAKGLFKEGLWD